MKCKRSSDGRKLDHHPTYAVSLEREPLGLLDGWMWAREARTKMP
jgi:hypothetical protein